MDIQRHMVLEATMSKRLLLNVASWHGKFSRRSLTLWYCNCSRTSHFVNHYWFGVDYTQKNRHRWYRYHENAFLNVLMKMSVIWVRYIHKPLTQQLFGWSIVFGTDFVVGIKNCITCWELWPNSNNVNVERYRCWGNLSSHRLQFPWYICLYKHLSRREMCDILLVRCLQANTMLAPEI